MKKILCLILTAFISAFYSASYSYCQDSRSVYFEILGASNALGISYDARFNQDSSSGLGWRAGIGFGYRYSSTGLAYDFSDTGSNSVGSRPKEESIPINIRHIYDRCYRLAVPLEINYLMGRGPSKFEVGAGGFLFADRYTSFEEGVSPENQFGFSPYLSAGMRLVTAKGFLLRGGVLPSFSFRTRDFSFWPYISIGRAF